MKKGNLAVLLAVGGILLAGFVFCLLHTPQDISVSERRSLAQFPEASAQALLSGQWMEDFEDYAADQFPFREELRTLKAAVQTGIYRFRDNNGIYVAEGSVSKLEYPLSENSIQNAVYKLNALYDTYLADTQVRVYFSIVPDKNYYLAKAHGYPALDYDRMVSLFTEGVSRMTYVDLFPLLEAGDYYRTDPHWRQDKLLPVAEALAGVMGVSDRLTGDYEAKSLTPFYGAYYGQSALALRPDTLTYLTNETIENCWTWNGETGEYSAVYNEALFQDVDPYDVFLSGAVPLITITNPAGAPGTELVLFRDSFGSSLAPLLIEAYETITLVDLRYMSSELLNQYLTFTDQDVLFLYSPSVWNNSYMLK